MLFLLACTQSPSPSDSIPQDPTADWVAGTGPIVTVRGQVFVFGLDPGVGLGGGTVSVMEAPKQSGLVSEDGQFSLEVASGAMLSFVFEKEGFATVQSGTFMVETEVEDLGFQVPSPDMVELMALATKVELDPDLCQVVTTVSSVESPPFGGAGVGEPGAVVRIAPSLPAGASGPIYFDYLSDSMIIPDPDLTETTIDGGVIFANLPPASYTLHATKTGVSFTDVTARCRPGMLINAAPPHDIEAEG